MFSNFAYTQFECQWSSWLREKGDKLDETRKPQLAGFDLCGSAFGSSDIQIL